MPNDLLPGLLLTGCLLLSPPGCAQQGGEAPRQAPAGREPRPSPTSWAGWWEVHSEAFLRAKDAARRMGPTTGEDFGWDLPSVRRKVDSLEPTLEQIHNGILPVLKKAIDDATERDGDLVAAALLALAEIGRDHAEFRLFDVLSKHLASRDPRIRETAALSLGIAGIAGEPPFALLRDLALDAPAGRQACGAPAVDERTRAFAICGLGLLGARACLVEANTPILRTLQQILADGSLASPELRDAAVAALGCLRLDDPAEPAQALRSEALATLENCLRQPPGTCGPLGQAHCATSLAKLVGRDPAQAGHFAKLLAERLSAPVTNGSMGHELPRACALALGQIGGADCSALLLDRSHDHPDEAVRAFALLALGQIGGAANQRALLAEFGKATDPDRKAWCALSLGVLAFRFREAQQQPGRNEEPAPTIGAALFAALQDHPDRRLLPALAIALGLSRHGDAAEPMRTLLVANVADEELAGALCTGLALLGDRRSIAILEEEVFAVSSQRLDLLQHSAIALVVLGDKTIEDKLSVRMMQDGLPLATLAAIAATLGRVGDARTVSPCRTMLMDGKRSPQVRALAARVLGAIADKETLPWHSRLGPAFDCRAAGVLELR